ncbi:MAG: hypothetical protein BIFFINMI_01043 [Phycisphaerae bacterium]|nr:hypothetical protein [Phycisphaerae bacterium]
MAWIVALLFAFPAVADAGDDYSDEAFSVRMPPAFVRFTEVSAFGGPTVANRYSSAINPAAADWFELPAKLGLVAAPYYANVRFDNGTNLNLVGESVTWDTRDFGTFQPTLSQIRSNGAKLRTTGLEFNYKVDTAQLQWGKRVDNWAVGATLNFAEAQVVQKMGALRVSESHAESYRFRFGGLYQPCDKWLLGLIGEYAFQPVRTKALAFTMHGPVRVKLEDTQQQILIRPGVSYEYAKLSTVFLDYAYGYYRNDSGNALHDHRFSTGIEHRVLDFLFLRASGSLDVRGNAGFSAGASLFFSKNVSLDVGYQYDMLPELRPEFGRSHIIQAALAIRF